MKTYTVLKLGTTTQFEADKHTIDSLINRGYKFIREIEAESKSQAQAAYKLVEKESVKEPSHKNPSGYLGLISVLFCASSIIGCLVFAFMGFEAAGTYRTRDFAPIYFASAAASFLLTLLIHSASKTLIYIANKLD